MTIPKLPTLTLGCLHAENEWPIYQGCHSAVLSKYHVYIMNYKVNCIFFVHKEEYFQKYMQYIY